MLALPLRGSTPELYHGKYVAGMFGSGEHGVWYDPSDFSTMFQDAAGTTPVTAMEQPVGLILDKSKGLVLGPELVTNGTFDTDTVWTKGTGWTISGGTANANIASGSHLDQSATTTSGRFYVVTFTVSNYVSGGVRVRLTGTANISGTVRSANGTYTEYLNATITNGTLRITDGGAGFVGSIDNISVRELHGNHAYQSTSASRPVLSARVNQYLNTATLATQNVTTLATTYTLRFEGAGSITLSGTATGTYTAGAHSVVCTAGTLTSTVTGTVSNADLRPTNAGVNLPAYQRVGASTDYDTAGFPAYLKFDGIDDYLVTNNIDFTATDKMTMCAGVRKLSDAAQAVVAEFSASAGGYTGTFLIDGPSYVPGPNYRFGTRGSSSVASAVSPAAYPAPTTNVITGLGNISGDSAILRANGAQVAADTATDQGTGNFGNYPLYIGRRGGTSLPFNGHLYGLIVRGAQTDDAHLTHAEKYLAYKSGVTL